MVKHTQTIRRLLLTNCLSVFDHFVELALKGLILGSRGRFQEQARLPVPRGNLYFALLDLQSNFLGLY